MWWQMQVNDDVGEEKNEIKKIKVNKLENNKKKFKKSCFVSLN